MGSLLLCHTFALILWWSFTHDSAGGVLQYLLRSWRRSNADQGTFCEIEQSARSASLRRIRRITSSEPLARIVLRGEMYTPLAFLG